MPVWEEILTGGEICDTNWNFKAILKKNKVTIISIKLLCDLFMGL